MCSTRTVMLLTLASAAQLASACDSGYRYHPINNRAEPVDPMRQSRDAIIFEMKGFTIFTGGEHCPVMLTVINNSKEKVVVLGGELHTNGKIIKETMPGMEEHNSSTILPGETGSIQLIWSLGRRASDVLGSRLVFVWRVSIGKQEDKIRFEMLRGK